jgi:hypothetical protein
LATLYEGFWTIAPQLSGIEIRGRPVVGDYHFLEKDDHVLTDGSPSDDLISSPVIVLCEAGALNFLRDYHL